LQQDGVGKNQISQVRGFADQMLRVKNDPLDPSNRRISLIVQWLDASDAPGVSAREAKLGDIGKNSPSTPAVAPGYAASK
jgi:chemotaxis protein MotB